MTSSKKRQRTLLEYASNSSPVRPSTKKRRSTSSGDDYNSDPGRIQFEHGVTEVDEYDKKPHAPRHLKPIDDGDFHPRQSSTRQHEFQSSPVISVHSSSSEGEVTRRKRPTRFRQSHHHVVVSDSDASESQQPRKKRRLVKGKRPEDQVSEADDGDENLIEEVDEDVTLASRLRDRSKKSAFAYNLERLQRRRRGQAATSESDEDDNGGSESSGIGPPAESAVFVGARPSRTVSDDDASQGGDVSEDSNGDNDFIVEDGGAENVPELPTMFSMGTFQDLSHHFKVICQLFVHLAVREPPGRRSFMENALKRNYFSVPLAIMRRKLSGMRDSLVASSIWKPEFKKLLETFPIFRLELLEFSVPICDACHLGNRVATLRGVLSGNEYNSLTYEPRHAADESEEGPAAADWNLGRFCAARAQVFHMFTHWEQILYDALRVEVEEAITTLNGWNGRRAFIPATNGPALPDDPDDADGMMDWLDGRGIISAQWARIKEMMERAHKLEAKGRGAEDEMELG